MLKLLRNLRRQEWAMAAVCAVLILGQINFDLALPDYMSSLTVLIKTPGSTLSDILHTGLEMLGCTLASAVLCVICGYLTAKVAAGFSFSIREAVFHKIADFGQQEMMTFSVPSLINRTTNDITQVQMLTAMGLQILIKSPVMAVWAIIKIVGKSWTLSAITAGFVAALLVMMAVIIGVVVPRFRRVQKLTDHINLVARENLNGINVVHAYNAEDYQNAKFWKGNEELMRTRVQPAGLCLPDARRHPGHERIVSGDLLGGCLHRERRPCRGHRRTAGRLQRHRGVRHLRHLRHHVHYDDGHDYHDAPGGPGVRPADQ